MTRFTAANEARRGAAAERDVRAARVLIASVADGGEATAWPRSWYLAALVRVAHPEEPWAALAARLGMTKDQAAAHMRRLRTAVERSTA